MSASNRIFPKQPPTSGPTAHLYKAPSRSIGGFLINNDNKQTQRQTHPQIHLYTLPFILFFRIILPSINISCPHNYDSLLQRNLITVSSHLININIKIIVFSFICPRSTLPPCPAGRRGTYRTTQRNTPFPGAKGDNCPITARQLSSKIFKDSNAGSDTQVRYMCQEKRIY